MSSFIFSQQTLFIFRTNDMACVFVGVAFESLMVSTNKKLHACIEYIVLVQHYFSKIKLVFFNFFNNYLSDHSSKMVHLLWVQPLKVLM